MEKGDEKRDPWLDIFYQGDGLSASRISRCGQWK
jgi:hypothetical protein